MAARKLDIHYVPDAGFLEVYFAGREGDGGMGIPLDNGITVFVDDNDNVIGFQMNDVGMRRERLDVLIPLKQARRIVHPKTA